MSQTMNLDIQIKDIALAGKCCEKMGLETRMVVTSMVVYDPQQHLGFYIHQNGMISFDDMHAHSIQPLAYRLKAHYGAEKAKQEARAAGYSVVEGEEKGHLVLMVSKWDNDTGRVTLRFSLESGECKVEASGFKGRSCEDTMKIFRDTLGKVTDFENKAEWYEQNVSINAPINSNLCG